MNVIPRTLGVAEIMSVPVSNIITAQTLVQLAQHGVEGYGVNCHTETCSLQGDFPLEHFCIAINTSDNRTQLVGLGKPTPDGAVPTVSVYYCKTKPDFTQYEMNTIEQMQMVTGEFNRILRQIRALEKGPENDLPVQGE